ncbi:MAG: fumarylacetoacetate hydrolase family protein [Thermoplasmata archaeon]|nr:fumarylacetoacetate hydrolase family protein [Thermoplasmata archaeon]
MSGGRTTPRDVRYVLRGVPAGGPATWLLSDGTNYFAPENAQMFPLHDPKSGQKLWEGRETVALSEMGAPESFLTPLPVARVFCPAVNFREHRAESGMQEPTEPYFFLKFASSAVPHDSIVTTPYQAEKVDFEGEIGIVIGRQGKHWTPEQAREAILGYTITNDLTLRDYQFREQPRYGKNWVMGKAFDGSLPIGPWILPKERLPEFETTIRTRVNGEVRQDGSTKDMIFNIFQLVAYLSEVNTLGPGDVVTTGTPAGVAAHQGQRYLRDGDRVEIEVAPIGTLRHGIAVERRP